MSQAMNKSGRVGKKCYERAVANSEAVGVDTTLSGLFVY